MSIRVLQVVTIMDRGGEETMIMNYYRHMDREKVQFDFLVHREQEGVYEKEILELGGRIFRTCPIRPWSYGKYKKWLQEFFEEHTEFAAVHSHIQENSGFVLAAAKRAGIPIRASHSHTAPDFIDYKYLFRLYAKRYMLNSTSQRFACGEKAGKWLYGNKPFMVLPNAVDTDIYHYDIQKRNAKRKELGLDDELVIGNVARFIPIKNHSFIIDIFNEIHKKNKNTVLVLIGIGETQNEIREKVQKLRLSTYVRFLDLRTDINELLQAIDVFLFPSILEGLPLSVIEAQAAGLPCFLSDTITREVGVIDETRFISLKEGAAHWADEILKVDANKRKDTTEQICAAYYDIKSNAAWLQNFYMGKAEEEK